MQFREGLTCLIAAVILAKLSCTVQIRFHSNPWAIKQRYLGVSKPWMFVRSKACVSCSASMTTSLGIECGPLQVGATDKLPVCARGGLMRCFGQRQLVPTRCKAPLRLLC